MSRSGSPRKKGFGSLETQLACEPAAGHRPALRFGSGRAGCLSKEAPFDSVRDVKSRELFDRFAARERKEHKEKEFCLCDLCAPLRLLFLVEAVQGCEMSITEWGRRRAGWAETKDEACQPSSCFCVILRILRARPIRPAEIFRSAAL